MHYSKKHPTKHMCGISLLADKENAYGLGIALDKEEIYYIPVEGLLTGDFLCASLKDLAKQRFFVRWISNSF